MNASPSSRIAISALILAFLSQSTGAAAAQIPEARPDEAEPASVKRTLDLGLWNARIEALDQFVESRAGAMPLLSYAAQDADWQVRLAAVHFLGKAGPQAAPVLAAVARVEPCPDVRISALKWLARMGDEGEPYYHETLTPEDERLMKEMPDRYGAERMGKPLVIDTPDAMTKEFFNGGLDLRVCASSEHSGHHDPRRDTQLAHTPAAEPGTPKQIRLDAELDALLEPEQPETLPPGEGLPPRPAADRPAGNLEMPQRPTLALAAVASGHGPRESFSPIPLLTDRETTAAQAQFEPDAGAGKPENDPVPVLIGRLSLADPRQRALAAEVLGKRGSAAAPAVPALRRALKDPDRRVRASAALALGDIGAWGGGVPAELKRALRDKNEDVRFSALLALKRIQSRLDGP